MMRRCFVIFIAVLFLAEATNIKSFTGKEDDATTFLRSHISEYETIEDFQKFLENAPPLLHPSLTEMWILQRQKLSAPRLIITTPDTDVTTTASTPILTTTKVDELHTKKQEKPTCQVIVEVTEDYGQQLGLPE